MSLTDATIKNAKPIGKTYKLSDDKGMYLLIKDTGGKYFRFDYRFAGKRKTLALGVYPETSLKEARERRDEARRLLGSNIDPLAEKQARKQLLLDEEVNNFEAVAHEWFAKQRSKWSEKHAFKKWRFLEKDVFPTFGKTPIKNISSKDLLAMLTKVQVRGAIDIAHKVKGICGEIFRYGIYTDKCERDPSQDLKGALIPKRKGHMATITEPRKIGGILRAIDGYDGDITTKYALKLTPYVMLRPGELRHAEWAEIDFEKKQWKIPGQKMKMGRQHIVPLSKQALDILESIRPITGQDKYAFPSLRSKGKPISDNTVNAALRRMGYAKDEMTAHGFRAMASTLLHENGFKTDIIETQLAHAERNQVKAAYNYAEYLDERADMLQWWADSLDNLRAQGSC